MTAEHPAVNNDRRNSRALVSSGSNLQFQFHSGQFSSPILSFAPSSITTMADRPQQPVRVARERKSSPVKTGYLVLYNAVSTILWATILGRVLLVASVHGTKYVFPAVGEFAKWTQTLALLEVVHAAVGELVLSLGTVMWERGGEDKNKGRETWWLKRWDVWNMVHRKSSRGRHDITDNRTTKHKANSLPSQASSAHPSSQPSCKSPAASS
jgi:hypothetical protein